MMFSLKSLLVAVGFTVFQRPFLLVIIMREFAAKFYKSRRWQTTRDAYLRSVGGLCERCLKKGLYHPAVIVHHKVYISPENINNPEITLSWNNLEAVCRECHEAEHTGDSKRYTVAPDGRVEIR